MCLQQPWHVKITVVVIYRLLWCDVWQQSPRQNNFQESMQWVGGNGSFYWQAFLTDQNLMGFIINSDDSPSLCSAFVRANKMKGWHFLDCFRLILAILLPSSRWKRLTSSACEPVDMKYEPEKHLINVHVFWYIAWYMGIVKLVLLSVWNCSERSNYYFPWQIWQWRSTAAT